MALLVRTILASFLLLAAACSMRATLDRLVSAEDKAFAFGFVDSIRRGDSDRLQAQFDPELWAKSRDELQRAATLFPETGGETRIIGYNSSVNISPGLRETRKQFILVTADGAHWTRTLIATFGRNGPAKIVSWNVEGLAEPPPELRMMDSWDAAVPWIRAGLALFVAALIALVWWLVRRSRRRSMPG